VSEWIVIKPHDSKQEAIDYHLDLIETFNSGGTTEEWEQGMDKYLELYYEHCPEDMRDSFDRKDKPMD
jgi:hypothetical protein